MLSFDIETAPKNGLMIPPFDESSVKYGNTKDEAKKKLLLEKRRKSWSEKFLAGATLRECDSVVLVIGYYDTVTESFWYDYGDEVSILEGFWTEFEKSMRLNRIMIGFFIKKFDLRFIRNRSIASGVKIPIGASTRVNGRFYWSTRFIDLYDEYLCTTPSGMADANFDILARLFNTAGKPTDVEGKTFFLEWERNREKAIDYLSSDVVQPAMWAKRYRLEELEGLYAPKSVNNIA